MTAPRSTIAPELKFTLPAWLPDHVDWRRTYATDEDRVRLAVQLAEQNVAAATGGPFGAAVFETRTGRLVSVGVNLVTSARSSVLHAEIVALMFAHEAVGSYSLRNATGGHDLAVSCDPCAMCLGAALWAGVGRVLASATREDAMEIGFEEGPVFPQSYDYLRSRGLELIGGIAREEGRAVLQRYQRSGAPIYNP